MSSTATAARVPAARYLMPDVKVGDVVVWAYSPGRLADSAAAIVTKVGQDAIALIYFPPDSRVGTPKDGVRYFADPANHRIESDAGVFDFAPAHKRLLALEALVESAKPAR